MLNEIRIKKFSLMKKYRNEIENLLKKYGTINEEIDKKIEILLFLF